MRERRRTVGTATNPILFERADWRLFVDPRTLPQKAGCEPRELGRIVAKELVDNALDAGADGVTVDGDLTRIVVRDNGPGIAPDKIATLFSVNRPLLSSKLKRLPTRGMLGNGLRVVTGAVVAFDGKLTVTSRRQRYELAHDGVTGETRIVRTSPATDVSGTVVEVVFSRPFFTSDDFAKASAAIGWARRGDVYDGPSGPSWYDMRALKELFGSAANGATVGEVVRDVFGVEYDDDRAARALNEQQISGLRLDELCPPVRTVGTIGEGAFGGQYRRVQDVARIGNAEVPFAIEVWCGAERVEKDEATLSIYSPIINRSLALAPIYFTADSAGLRVRGCGLDFKVQGAKRAEYSIVLSLISPYLRLTGDGKAPYLADFAAAISQALNGAARAAYRNMIRPPASMSVKDAAYTVMEAAYLKASDDGKLPAKARQIMYAARGEILRLTGAKKFSDMYFTQVLLPDYMNHYSDETAGWDVVFDARGNLTEPHTQRRVPLGTIQVRTYLGDRPPLGPAVQINGETLYPTSGPENRYRNILFIEKEGFDELFEAVQLAERYDLAIMSTKGMSVVAARALLDRLADQVDNVLVLHDFDVSGFSISRTLGSDSRRYIFENDMSEKIIDVGLRLEDVEELGLEAETVQVDSREARRAKLEEHGATDDEIEFLVPTDGDEECRRVELNAMTSRQLVDFVEQKLAEHGVDKVMPENGAIEGHARRLIERTLTEKAIAEMAPDIARRAADAELPKDLDHQIATILVDHPELSWDQALAQVVATL